VERLREGGRLARDGRIVEAVDAYREAREMDPQLMVSSGQLNTLCWYGALWEHAADVMDACEEAVALSPNSANIRDSRGVARALTSVPRMRKRGPSAGHGSKRSRRDRTP
jgi:hypothetical protein